ncbi:cytoskeleton-associated protein 2-like [Polyodon spathula]|uniref:cytoskeleton-associated protein 2-like n=1 Tax=Polyodon spathula TaxID=7913 RepID=UPI001B7E8D16|nr:cytoskeleton-associated protein 2-like [Polyodon spathula]
MESQLKNTNPRMKEHIQRDHTANRLPNTKAVNKENTRPEKQWNRPTVKEPPKQKAVKLEPMQSSNHAVNKEAPVKKEGGDSHRQVDEGNQVGNTAFKNPAEMRRRTTLSYSFLSHRNNQQKQLIEGKSANPKPAVPCASKPVLGAYRGKVVQSKVSSFRKPATTGEEKTQPEVKAVASKPIAQKTNAASNGKASVQKPGIDAPTTSAQAAKSTVTNMQKGQIAELPLGGNVFQQKEPKATNILAVSRPVSSSTAGPAPQPRLPVTMKKNDSLPKENPKTSEASSQNRGKPSNTVLSSKYKIKKETAEERRLRLAEWLATKGKTLKRPSMVLQAGATLKQAPKKEPITSLNTTMEMDDNDEQDLPVLAEETNEPLDKLCCALADMLTTSKSNTDGQRGGSESEESTGMDQKDSVKAEEKDLKLEPHSQSPAQAEKHTLKVEKQCKEENESDEDEEIDEKTHDLAMKTPGKDTATASVVKYNVKTTPYLQSVKKRIQGEGSKSAIKDLKFLTPVRRSQRINRMSYRLPEMLMDHDPCVSSLAELAGLDGEANAYIYRQNPALQEVARLCAATDEMSPRLSLM